jgi:hypothetical protein
VLNTLISTMHTLSWAIRIFYLFVLTACIANMIMATRNRFKPHWRIEFGFSSVVTGVFMLYVFFRLSGALDPQQYAKAVRWLYPCLAIPYFAVPLLFHWEDKYFKRALHKKVRELIESDDS